MNLGKYISYFIQKNFIQVFIGAVLYFYYVGLASEYFVDKEIYGIYFSDPSMVEVIIAGIFGFLFLLIFISLGVFLRGCFEILHKKILEFYKKNKLSWLIAALIESIVLFTIFFGLASIILNIFKGAGLMIASFLFGAIFLFSFMLDDYKAFFRSKIKMSLVSLFLLSFLAYYPLLLSVGFTEILKKQTFESTVEIVTLTSLDLPNEYKMALGYLNQLRIVTHIKDKYILLASGTNQIVIVKESDVVRIKTLPRK